MKNAYFSEVLLAVKHWIEELLGLEETLKTI